MKNKCFSLVEKVMHIFFFACGMTAIIATVLITLYLVASGLPAIMEVGFFRFIFGMEWASTAENAQFGILPFILSSVYATAGALVLGVPVGIGMAIFLAKLAPHRLSNTLCTVIDLLAGIPSVVYGLVGMMVLVPAMARLFNLANGSSLACAIVVLAVMILPGIVSVSKTALVSVPSEYEHSSLALGASKMQTIIKVSVPAAKRGIATGIVLGVGRAVGEAMAVMMVAGNVANMPKLFSSVTLLTTAVAKEMSYASGLQRDALFSIALVLFCFIMLINIVLGIVLKREKK